MATSTHAYDQPALRVDLEGVSGPPAELEAELAAGRRVELVRGEKSVAELRAPDADAMTPPPGSTAATFDWAGQLREMWGDRVFDVDTTQWIREDRDARG